MAYAMTDQILTLIRREHDAMLGLRHIGVLIPWANTVVEAELPRLGLSHIVWHYARLVPDNQGTALDDSFLQGLIRAVPGALHRLSRLPLAAVLLACTSAGFSYPRDVPVVSAFDALLSGLRRLGARRVLLLTPYPDHLAEREAKALEARGHTVVGHASLGWKDGFADVTSDQILVLLERFTRATLEDADALVLSCTAWPTLDVIEAIEARTDRPVISSNLALAIAATSQALA